jgi:hypothetical protein
VSVRVSTWAWKQPLRGTAKLVLLALADQANDSGTCWPGQETLAEKCGLSLRALRDRLQALEDGQYIGRERRHGTNGARTSDLYTVNVPAVFAAGGGDHRQNVHRLPAKTGRSKRQDSPVSLITEPSGEPGPRRGFARFDKAVKR